LPWFKKTENYTLSGKPYSTYYYNYTGPVHIASTNIGDVSLPLFLQACVDNGYPNNTDFNAASRYGCGTQVTNTKEGIRSATVHAYLAPNFFRPNLHLLIKTQVTKILFRNVGRPPVPQAYAVQYVRNNVTYTVRANKEIILTAGAILTPKLLLLSGIGNSTALEALGIPVVYNNPNVGKNLQNNQNVIAYYSYPGNNFPNGWQVATAASEFSLNRTGPYANYGALGYLYANSNTSIRNYTNYLIAGMATNSFQVIGSLGGNTPAMAVQVATVNPKLRGTVTLHSADPFDPPNLDLNVWGNQQDVNAIIGGIRTMRSIWSTAPLTEVIGAEVVPGPGYETDAQLSAWIIANGVISGHWTGSAQFGDDGNPKAVLDARLRVRGVTGLRVGDASTIPIMGTHSHCTTVMVAERAAAFVLEENS